MHGTCRLHCRTPGVVRRVVEQVFTQGGRQRVAQITADWADPWQVALTGARWQAKAVEAAVKVGLARARGRRRWWRTTGVAAATGAVRCARILRQLWIRGEVTPGHARVEGPGLALRLVGASSAAVRLTRISELGIVASRSAPSSAVNFEPRTVRVGRGGQNGAHCSNRESLLQSRGACRRRAEHSQVRSHDHHLRLGGRVGAASTKNLGAHTGHGGAAHGRAQYA
eukprot:SAG11_NODE_2969_length_2803_cov_14.767012_4_plen_226_part_00